MEKTNTITTEDAYVPMYLMNSEFEKGKVNAFIDSVNDPTIKAMALAEYYFFTGRQAENVAITSEFLNHRNFSIKASAWLLYSFGNLSLNNQKETVKGISFANELIGKGAEWSTGTRERALLVLFANAANVLLHLDVKDVPPLNEYLQNLTSGLRVFGCYIMAHQAYLKCEYERGLGIVETGLAFEGENHIIATIYLLLAGAMNAMSLNKVELGKTYFMKAYELAKEDELFEPIGEHHGLLQGLIESCLKKSEKQYFERIIEITYRFSYGWRRVHNPLMSEDVADTLTTTEFSIAMLANRGWTNNEIAEYFDININTVKTHLTNVFDKLGINSRKELKKYMLK